MAPRSRSPRIVSHAWCRASGSKPVVGSSMKMSSGFPTSARPRSIRRFLPARERSDARVALVAEANERKDLLDVTRAGVVAGEELEDLDKR